MPVNPSKKSVFGGSTTFFSLVGSSSSRSGTSTFHSSLNPGVTNREVSQRIAIAFVTSGTSTGGSSGSGSFVLAEVFFPLPVVPPICPSP